MANAGIRRAFKPALLVLTHALCLALGVGLGIYILPILTAPPAPAAGEVAASASQAMFSGEFRRDLKDSDSFHWGEGTVSVGPRTISLAGKLAPGPDYKLYLSPSFVETEAEFMRLKASMVRVGDVKTFENFIVEVPPAIDVTRYDTVVVWCESFSQFITAARYRGQDARKP
jgi:hypothetical protein